MPSTTSNSSSVKAKALGRWSWRCTWRWAGSWTWGWARRWRCCSSRCWRWARGDSGNRRRRRGRTAASLFESKDSHVFGTHGRIVWCGAILEIKHGMTPQLDARGVEWRGDRVQCSRVHCAIDLIGRNRGGRRALQNAVQTGMSRIRFSVDAADVNLSMRKQHKAPRTQAALRHRHRKNPE